MSVRQLSMAVTDLHSPGNMAVCMRKVLARPWVGVFVPLALSLSYPSLLSDPLSTFRNYLQLNLTPIRRPRPPFGHPNGVRLLVEVSRVDFLCRGLMFLCSLFLIFFFPFLSEQSAPDTQKFSFYCR